MAEPLVPVLLAATGNRFAVLDAVAPGGAGPGDDPAGLARELCAGADPPLDGLLVLARPRAAGVARMEVFNRDGSRAEACGNGLRCAAKLLFESGRAPGTAFVVETDGGPRTVEVVLAGGAVRSVRCTMGVPRVVALGETLAVGSAPYEVHLVEMGNPHCVLFVRDPQSAPVAELGPQLERHVRFRRGTNVGFAAARPDGIHLRVWERGVGETASCGTGAAAAAVVCMLTDRARSPALVHTRGGRLEVDWDGAAELRLAGPVEEVRA